MLVDYFTKPLQGSLFIKFRRVIMGYNPISILRYFSPSKMNECVEKSDEILILDEQKISGKKVSFSDEAKKGVKNGAKNIAQQRNVVIGKESEEKKQENETERHPFNFFF